MYSVEITPKAAEEIQRVVAEQNETTLYLRLKIVGGGCSGFMTKLDFDAKFDETKDVFIESNGVKILVDKRSLLYANGAKIQFHEDLNKRGFSVDIPVATGRCGCGSSFTV